MADNSQATDDKKKAMFKVVGGPDLVFLLKYEGKVLADATYKAAITTIYVAIIGQTNQVMIRFKLFTAMPQEGQPFSTWWTKIKEQADKNVSTDYN